MYQIYWTNIAQDAYLQILDDAYQRWSIDTVIEIEDRVQNLLSKLQSHSQLCPSSERYSGLRRCVISKHTSMLYRIKESTIEIITFFSNSADHPY